MATARPTSLIVPLGATEQHGHHLPLDTDTVIAEAWARAVAGRIPATFVAPALPYGSSGEHQGFAGTLSIGQEALVTVLVELARSAAAADFRRLILLSGHAGNVRPIGVAVGRLRDEGRDVHHFVPTWAPDRWDRLDAHGGRTETSLMLHLRPDEVRRRLAPGTTAPLAELMERMEREGVAAVSDSGVLGDPAGATADEGAALLADLVERTVITLTALPSPGSRPEPAAEETD